MVSFNSIKFRAAAIAANIIILSLAYRQLAIPAEKYITGVGNEIYSGNGITAQLRPLEKQKYMISIRFKNPNPCPALTLNNSKIPCLENAPARVCRYHADESLIVPGLNRIAMTFTNSENNSARLIFNNYSWSFMDVIIGGGSGFAITGYKTPAKYVLLYAAALSATVLLIMLIASRLNISLPKTCNYLLSCLLPLAAACLCLFAFAPTAKISATAFIITSAGLCAAAALALL